MKILALLRPAAGKPLSNFASLALPEEQMLWPKYKAGVVREMYFQEQPMIIGLVVEASDHAAARTALADLPMVEAGLFDIECITLGPWLPLERLFAHDR